MSPLIVVDNPKTWPLQIPGASLVSARDYLTEPHYSELRAARVFNLCKSYRYHSTGYYVSLLAMARDHKPIPNITTIQDLKSNAMVRLASDEMVAKMQSELKRNRSTAFTLSVYFGRNMAKRYEAISAHLFRLFPAPLLRVEFEREDDEWRLNSVRPIAASDIPESHKSFVIEAAQEFFRQKRPAARRRDAGLFDLAILVNPDDPTPPSNPLALKRFAEAAKRARLDVELIEKDDYGRLAEFDALFIRETTAVNHHTYRFSRRAVKEGMVVIDDPESITKCTNKVYLAELLDRHNIPKPRTLIVHRENTDQIRSLIGLPCVLKQPDSSFSQGVTKVESEGELAGAVEKLLESSDLVIAQEFLPTPYDWRVCVLDRKPLFCCRYFMASRHWQIVNRGANGETDEGRVEAVTFEAVPPPVLNTAVRAAKLVGDGLYGVDLKYVNDQVYVIEINDNPNIDAGYDDQVFKMGLYDRIMQVFLERIMLRKVRNGNP